MEKLISIPILTLDGPQQEYYAWSEDRKLAMDDPDCPDDNGILFTLWNDLRSDVTSFNDDEYIEIIEYIRYRLKRMDINPLAVHVINFDDVEMTLYLQIKFISINEEED